MKDPVDCHSVKIVPGSGRLVETAAWKIQLCMFLEKRESGERRKSVMKPKEIISSILYHDTLVVGPGMLS